MRVPPSTAFVASLLPAKFLTTCGASLNVTRIVVLNRVHEQAYDHVARRLNGVTVTRLRGGQVGAAVWLLFCFLFARIRGRRIIFFHECCWPVFDLLLDIVKPRGQYFPQVTMESFDKLSRDDMPPPGDAKDLLRLILLRLTGERFIIYRNKRSSGADAGYEYALSYRHYPPAIEVAPLGAVPAAEGATAGNAFARIASNDVRRVLMVTGTEPLPDEDLRNAFVTLIEVALNEGYAVFVKDHPITRLHVPCAGCTQVDPTLPIELIPERFDFSIGVASTGILGAGDRKLSILDMLPTMPDDTRRMRRQHLIALPGGNRIEFVTSADDVRARLREHRLAAAARRP